ncbi:hypothetical protein SCLCIDRAFT_1099564 [Scleroderma citrinum Foug A]|uniref:Uncharacterized protein n=1 Tax=Scleroderma citrinum Foug A TaxID=1036808 RepID=A0A0C3DPV3_9AGAM|nr:hypothetical protein SCLCIDRAFT_1099564 [Scleroderma citrinum Foug A]
MNQSDPSPIVDPPGGNGHRCLCGGCGGGAWRTGHAVISGDSSNSGGGLPRTLSSRPCDSRHRHQ